MKERCVVGIDEVGRGPLAGPVTVGVVVLLKPIKQCELFFEGWKDSKQLSEKKREEFAEMISELEQQNVLRCACCSVGASHIDERGIMSALRTASARALDALSVSHNQPIQADAGLPLPVSYENVNNIVKGDETVLPIALASIIAKVTRDTYMKRMDRKFPEYGFAQHKGYGTRAHREAIERYGFSPLHRVSFCKNIEVAEKGKERL